MESVESLPDDTSEHSHFAEELDGVVDTSRTLLGHLGVDRMISGPTMASKNKVAEGLQWEFCGYDDQRFLINS